MSSNPQTKTSWFFKSTVNNPEEQSTKNAKILRSQKLINFRSRQPFKIVDMNSQQSESDRNRADSSKQASKLDELRRQLLTSKCFKYVLAFLPKLKTIQLQALCRYFYAVQIPRSLHSCQTALQKHRLHLINDDHIIIFDLLDMTKSKRLLRWERGFRFLDQNGRVDRSKITDYSEQRPFECNIWNS